MKCIGLLLAAAATVTIACGPKAEDGAIGTTGAGANEPIAATPAVSDGDRSFVSELAIANNAEVELGKLALKQSSNADVKKFGQMMIDDHTIAGQKLRDVASAHSITAPDSMDETHQALYSKLSGMKGPAFDREYMDTMVNGHETVLGKLESRIDKVSLESWKTRIADAIKGRDNPEPPPVVAETSSNPATTAINQWAAGTYPGVYRHFQSAKSIDETVKGRPARTQ